MAKKTLLKERGTNEDLYPVTSSDCVIADNTGKLLSNVINEYLKKILFYNFQ